MERSLRTGDVILMRNAATRVPEVRYLVLASARGGRIIVLDNVGTVRSIERTWFKRLELLHMAWVI